MYVLTALAACLLHYTAPSKPTAPEPGVRTYMPICRYLFGLFIRCEESDMIIDCVATTTIDAYRQPTKADGWFRGDGHV